MTFDVIYTKLKDNLGRLLFFPLFLFMSMDVDVIRICANMECQPVASEWLRGKQHVYLIRMDDRVSRCLKRLYAD